MTDVGSINESTTLPSPPRLITSKVRRRAFAELPVRPWAILSVLILGITLYFTITRVIEAMQDRWLIEHGTPVEAKFEMVNSSAVPKRQARNEAMPCRVSFELNGHPKTAEIILPAKPDSFATVGTTLPIRVDPSDLSRWTEQTVPLPWLHELTTVFMLVPICVLLLAVTYLRYRSTLSIYRNGEVSMATAVDVRHTAAAPNQRLVRVHYESGDRRVFSLLAPAVANLQKGQSIPLLHLPQRRRRAVLASCYS